MRTNRFLKVYSVLTLLVLLGVMLPTGVAIGLQLPPPGGRLAGPPVPGETAGPVREMGGSPGYIDGGQVNIRSGPSTRHEIIAVLEQGTPVRVFARAGNWLRIAYPEQAKIYIHEKHIAGEVPAVIDPAGLQRQVATPDAPLHVRRWDKATVAGTLSDGDRVTIIGRRGDWLQVKVPDVARAWVSAKFTKVRGEVRTEEARPEPEVVPGTRGTPGGGGTVARKREDTIREAVEKARAAAPAGSTLSTTTRRAITLRESRLEERQETMEDILQDLQAQLQAIESGGVAMPPAGAGAPAAVGNAGSATVITPVERAPAAPGASYTGWVEYAGGEGRPAAYRLVEGGVEGRVLFLLTSEAYNLADYVNTQVSVSGPISRLTGGWEADLMKVTSLQPLGGPDPSLGPVSTAPPAPAPSAPAGMAPSPAPTGVAPTPAMPAPVSTPPAPGVPSAAMPDTAAGTAGIPPAAAMPPATSSPRPGEDEDDKLGYSDK